METDMKRLAALVLIQSFLLPAGAAAQTPWTAPIGIPRPSFGVEESYRLYDSAANRNPALNYTQNTEGGFYTHYVSTAGCTDTANPFGTAVLPRCRIPLDLPEGSVVEVHGGPFTYGNYNGNTAIGINGAGTSARPIYIRGINESDRPLLQNDIWLRGHYVILENLRWDLNQITTNALSIRYAAADAAGYNHHLAVRHCEAGNVSRSSGSGAVFNAFGDTGRDAEDIVYYHNYIHPDDIDVLIAAPESREKDTVGISIANNTNRIWIVDNTIHGSAGDSVGAGHGDAYTARNYFIGRNELYNSGENAIDSKEVENIVVSQNKMHDMYGYSAGSDGTVGVIHYGPTYSPRNYWFLFNEVYNANSGGFQVGGDSTNESYFIGNIFHDIKNDAGTGRAFYLRNSHPGHLIGNLFYNNDRHVVTGPSVSGSFNIVNNIFADVLHPGTGLHIDHEQAATGTSSTMLTNLFFQSNGAVRINWGGQILSQVPQTVCPTCIYADPRFVNAASGNFRLLNDSPAIDAGSTNAFYSLFNTVFPAAGTIAVDFTGSTRPRGQGWDLGPFEIISGGVAPAAPGNLRIMP